MADVVEVAYRAFCEAKLGRELSEAEFRAIHSQVEVKWLTAALAAARMNAEEAK